MLDIRKGFSSLMCVVVLGGWLASQVPPAVSDPYVVPTLVKFSGTLTPAAGRGLVGVTFAVYRDQEGGALDGPSPKTTTVAMAAPER